MRMTEKRKDKWEEKTIKVVRKKYRRKRDNNWRKLKEEKRLKKEKK